MSQRNLASVLFKVLGVMCIIRAIDGASWMFALELYSFSNFGRLPLLGSVLSGLVYLVLLLSSAFILLRYANPIAAKLFPVETAAFPGDSVPSDQWYVFAFRVLGVILLVWYVPSTMARCVSFFVFSIQPDRWLLFIQLAMELALGLCLIFGAPRIAALLRKLRPE